MKKIKKLAVFFTSIFIFSFLAAVAVKYLYGIFLSYPVLDELCFVTFWQIAVISILCALSSIFLFPDKDISKKELIIRTVLHLLSVYIIVIGFGALWKWLDLSNITTVILMALFILFVYIIVWIIILIYEKHTSEQLNKKLREIYKQNFKNRDS